MRVGRYDDQPRVDEEPYSMPKHSTSTAEATPGRIAKREHGQAPISELHREEP